MTWAAGQCSLAAAIISDFTTLRLTATTGARGLICLSHQSRHH